MMFPALDDDDDDHDLVLPSKPIVNTTMVVDDDMDDSSSSTAAADLDTLFPEAKDTLAEIMIASEFEESSSSSSFMNSVGPIDIETSLEAPLKSLRPKVESWVIGRDTTSMPFMHLGAVMRDRDSLSSICTLGAGIVTVNDLDLALYPAIKWFFVGSAERGFQLH